jgi:hypothetical protein
MIKEYPNILGSGAYGKTIPGSIRGFPSLLPRIRKEDLLIYHDLYNPNLFSNSNTLSAWTATASTAVESTTYIPRTGRKAWKLVEDNTENFHCVTQSYSGVATYPYCFSVVCKAGDRDHLAIYLDNNSGAGFARSIFDLATGTWHSNTSGNYGIESLGDGWYRIWVSGNNSGTGVITGKLYIITSAGEGFYTGGGASPYTEADPGLYIGDAQLNNGLTPLKYTLTDSRASAPDASGNGYVFTKGAGGATPLIKTYGLNFNLGGYCITGDIPITMGSSWTVILVACFSGTAGGVWGFGAENTQRQYLGYSESEKIWMVSKSGTPLNVSTAISVHKTLPIVVVVTNKDDVIRLKRLDTGEAQSITDLNPTGTAKIATHTFNTGTTTAPDSLTLYSHIFYRSCLDDAEIDLAYQYLKLLWKSRGLTIL